MLVLKSLSVYDGSALSSSESLSQSPLESLIIMNGGGRGPCIAKRKQTKQE